jgi:Flp pilus assembly protein TadD
MEASMLDAQRRFFISHSSLDRTFAIGLRDALGPAAWVDLYEIEVGQIVLEEIAAGIEEASDFVLLWSANSARSPWVRFEFHMAFVRHLEDGAIALRIVLLDDAPVPLLFRPFLQARDVRRPADVAELLLGTPPRLPPLRAFVDRNAEVDAIEASLYASGVGHLWLSGMAGVGKRSIAREGLSRILGDRTRARFVQLRAGTEAVELDLLISAALGAETPPALTTPQEALGRAMTAIETYAANGGIWVFEEAHHWLLEDAEPRPLLRHVLEALANAKTEEAGRLAIFTTTRKPDIGAMRYARDSSVGGLTKDYGIALLRAHGSSAEEHVLARAADELAGHPLSLEIAAKTLSDAEPDWEEFRVQAATGMVGGLELDSLTAALLQRLAAVDGPLSAESYAAHLEITASEVQAAVAAAVSFSLVEETSLGYLRVHPLVRDFYMRAFRREVDFLDRASDLADRVREVFLNAAPESMLYVDALVSTFRLLAWSQRIEEAMELHRNLYGTLFETAVELYHQQKYGVAERYFRLVIDSDAAHREARLYLARTLAYLGDVDSAREIVGGLIAETPDDAYSWRVRGRIEYIARAFGTAAEYYEHAVTLRPTSAATLRDLGQVRIRLRDWVGARAALERAVELRARDPDPYLAFQYSIVLEHDGEYEEAQRLVSQAIRRDPENALFHHRLGRIALELGQRDQAEREFRDAVRLDPGHVEAMLSLASMAADDGRTDIARRELARAIRQPRARVAVLRTIEAKILLAEGSLMEAREVIRKAVEAEPEPASMLLSARIELEAASRGSVDSKATQEYVSRMAEAIRLQGETEAADRLLADAARAVEPGES